MRRRLFFIVVFACMVSIAFCAPFVSVSFFQEGGSFSIDLSRSATLSDGKASGRVLFTAPGTTRVGELFIQTSGSEVASVEVSVVPASLKGFLFSSAKFPWSEHPCVFTMRVRTCGDSGEYETLNTWSAVKMDGFIRLSDYEALFQTSSSIVDGSELCVRIPSSDFGKLSCDFALTALEAQEPNVPSDDYSFDFIITVRALDVSGNLLEQTIQTVHCQGYLDTAPLDARFTFSVEPTALCQSYPLSDPHVTSEWGQVAAVSFRSASFVVTKAYGDLSNGDGCPFAIALGTDSGCVSTAPFEFIRRDGSYNAGTSIPFSIRLVPDMTTAAVAHGLEAKGLPVRTSDIRGELGSYSCMVDVPTFGGGTRFVVVPAVVGRVLDGNGSMIGHWGWSGALEICLPTEVLEDVARRRVVAGRYRADIYVCVISRL